MNKIFILSLLCAFMLSFALPIISYAQILSKPTPSGGNGTTLRNPLEKQGINSLQDLLPKLLALIVQIGTILATFFIILAGFKYVTAGGDPKNIEDAHRIFLWTVVGTVVLLGAQIISTLLGNTVKSIIGK